MAAPRRSPHSRGWATGAASSSPSAIRNLQRGDPNQSRQQQPAGRWGSNLSSQRRERAMWAACLRKVQAVQRGGLWQSSATASNRSGRSRNVMAIAADAEVPRGIMNDRQEGSVLLGFDGSNGAEEVGHASAEDELGSQLDTLATLAYPNSSISPQDAGLMMAALCEAVPPSSAKLGGRVGHLYTSLCAKQRKVSFSAWQLDIVLGFFLDTLATEPGTEVPTQGDRSLPHGPSSAATLAEGQGPSPHECVRALAQLLYENADRLGTRFEDILPRLLYVADPSAVDMETRHAALDALANLCFKNWAGFSAPQRAEVCSFLTRNFDAHWRAFCLTSPPLSNNLATKSSHPAALLATESKVLASATRGVACAVGKAGVFEVLEPYLSRVIHALNHLVQPASERERIAAAATARGDGGSSSSASRSRSRGRGLGHGSGGGVALSPSRSGARFALADPRARVRLQALSLLEAIATKDAKVLYPHWILFLGGEGTGAGEVAGLNYPASGSPVLPPGLLHIMESDNAPQIRAAAAAAATSMIKKAPLRMWMPLAARPTSLQPGKGVRGRSVGGSGVGGIGERVASMMLRLQRSIQACLAREKSAAVAVKLCACCGALVSEVPYEVVSIAASGNCPGRGESDFEDLLRVLLVTLTTIMLDGSADPSARIAASQALTAAFSAKEPLAALDAFMRDFRCDPFVDGGAVLSNTSSTPTVNDIRLGPPTPSRAGGTDDRSNRFTGRFTDRRSLQSTRGGGADTDAGGRTETFRNVGAMRGGPDIVSWRRSSPISEQKESGGIGSTIVPPPPPLLRATGLSNGSRQARCTDPAGFVDCLINLAESPGQLRTEALGLLTRIGRAYPSHLRSEFGDGLERVESSNFDSCDVRASAGGQQTLEAGTAQAQDREQLRKRRWHRISGLLLSCFADPDQNLRLHALKVLEAVLLAREERAAAGFAEASVFLARSTPEQGDSHAMSETNVGRRKESEFATSVVGQRSGIRDGLWDDLVQKHLQRALEDPYHGVRAVACSCHGCLLDSDWEAFSEQKRDRCLNRLLASTRDRAAGVNVLACRVIAGLMTMAGKPDAAQWCREPQFLERCATRLGEMMGDSKASIRSQAVLAVGNLSSSLHSIRSRSNPATAGEAIAISKVEAQQPTRNSNHHHSNDDSPVSLAPDYGPELVARPQLRSLCESALRLATNEPVHSAGSAARALGYLAWSLDPRTADTLGAIEGSQYSITNGRYVREISGNDGVVNSALVVGAAQGAQASQNALTRNQRDGTTQMLLGPTASALKDTNERREGSTDRILQDKAVLTLAARANAALTEEMGLKSGKHGERREDQLGGGSGREGGGSAGSIDRRADTAAAKCRWNCCIALGILLSAPGVHARIRHAPWAGVLLRSLRRAMEEDRHLKVRTHAAMSLKAFPDVLAYGDELSTVFGGVVRLLQACGKGTVVSDPTQMRYAGALEVALRSLALHMFLVLVFDAPTRLEKHSNNNGNDEVKKAGISPLKLEGERSSSLGPVNDIVGGTGRLEQETAVGNDDGGLSEREDAIADALGRSMLLGEHADVLLEIVSSPKSNLTLTTQELRSYVVNNPALSAEVRSATESDADSDSPRVDYSCVSPVGMANIVLGAAAQELVRLFSGGATREQVVSENTLKAWGFEASRRHARAGLKVGSESTTEGEVGVKGKPCSGGGFAIREDEEGEM